MITIPIGFLIVLPFIGIALALGLIEGYAQITFLKIKREIKNAEEQVKKCEKDLNEMSKEYLEKQGEIKAALEAYAELVSLLGMKK